VWKWSCDSEALVVMFDGMHDMVLMTGFHEQSNAFAFESMCMGLELHRLNVYFYGFGERIAKLGMIGSGFYIDQLMNGNDIKMRLRDRIKCCD
jgi:hypothetical protein